MILYEMHSNYSKIDFALCKYSLVDLHGLRSAMMFNIVYGDGLPTLSMERKSALSLLILWTLQLCTYLSQFGTWILRALFGLFNGCFGPRKAVPCLLFIRQIVSCLFLVDWWIQMQRREILQVVCQHFSLIYAFFHSSLECSISESKRLGVSITPSFGNCNSKTHQCIATRRKIRRKKSFR